MKANGNIELVQKYFECLANGNLEYLGELFAEDIVWHQPGHGTLSKTYSGKQELFSLFGKFMAVSEGTFKIDTVDAIMNNGDLVTAILHFTAQKSNGQSVSMYGIDLMRIENGHIKEVHLFSENQNSEDEFWG